MCYPVCGIFSRYLSGSLSICQMHTYIYIYSYKLVGICYCKSVGIYSSKLEHVLINRLEYVLINRLEYVLINRLECSYKSVGIYSYNLEHVLTWTTGLQSPGSAWRQYSAVPQFGHP